MATILSFHSPLSPYILEQAVDCIQSGGVLAVPTDSYYALASGIFQPAALEHVLEIKGKRNHKPFPILISQPSQLDQLVDEVPEIAWKLMQQFWPGLLTLVLKAKPHLPSVILSEQGAIGVRQPHDARLCELLIQTGPVTGTSANYEGQSPAQSAEDVMQQLGSKIDLILDGGLTPGGQPSTVLQVEPEFRVLRQGAIPVSVLSQNFSKNEG